MVITYCFNGCHGNGNKLNVFVAIYGISMIGYVPVQSFVLLHHQNKNKNPVQWNPLSFSKVQTNIGAYHCKLDVHPNYGKGMKIV